MRNLMLAIVWLIVAGEMTMAAEHRPHLKVAAYGDLAGWPLAGHEAVFDSFIPSCREILAEGRGFKSKPEYAGRKSDWKSVCASALRHSALTPKQAREFFETNFVPIRVHDPAGNGGLFTGYYEPEVAGSLKQRTGFNVPLYARPNDLVAFDNSQQKITGLKYGRLVDGRPEAYLSRRQIEQGALAGKGLELVWLKSWADAFFIQVQGSGRVRLQDDTVIRLGFAGKTGLPYTAIGAILIKDGEVAREDMSMQAIRAWMDKHPDRARELMWANASYVFFRLLKLDNPRLGPLGAQQVQLRAMHSLAVDRRFWALGTPMWIETKLPALPAAPAERFNQFMIAQDTGSAIKGEVRGDIFFGAGEEAALLAGNMQSSGTMFALLPRAVVRRLGLGK